MHKKDLLLKEFTFKMYDNREIKLAVIGLGYVGLPLLVEFAKVRKVIGFDINSKRISELKNGIDKTLEIEGDELKLLQTIEFTCNYEDLEICNCYIITVPTPIHENNEPDFSYIKNASIQVSKVLKKNDIVIYESTVYPGCTEELCVPILEQFSGLIFNKDFFCGYSPERINPGDKEHRINNIIKIVSGSNQRTTEIVNELYKEIVKAGTHVASSIRVAEAAKVIENTQRDLNIALINELSVLFNKLDIDTEEVLLAADTKWNFQKFNPGLVGGHCIGVDPYYLTYKALSVGYTPEVILAGRKINNGMSTYVVQRVIEKLIQNKINTVSAKVLVLGITFKENCPDIRNSKTFDVVTELNSKELETYIYDPWLNDKDRDILKNFTFLDNLNENIKYFDVIIISVGHDLFKEMGIDFLKSRCKENHIIFDLKYVFKKEETDLRL